ncbi:transmembrane efflux protein [Filimonas lacunae]|nr:transmembrane efflux protein [Filimonas lacunae]
MTEFVMMGILPDLSRTMDISIPVAGHLISAYALGVVLGAPLLVGIAGKYPPKKILMGLMLLFTLFNGISALAPTYELLFIARLFSGLPHGAFFGVGAVVASRLAEPGREARAISIMFAGLTLANIIGVPLGTWIGHNLDWRYTFVIIAGVGMLAVWSVKMWMPVIPAPENSSLKSNLQVFTRSEPWLIVGITAIGTGGLFAWFSYISKLMTEVAGFSENSISFILVLAGAGMAVGNVIGGKMADRFSAINATALLLLVMVASLLTVSAISQYKAAAIIMTFVTGAVAFAMVAPVQMLMIKAATGAEMLAASVSQASFNIGNAIGAFLGGLPIAAGLGYTSPQWVGAALALGGFLFCIPMFVLHKKQKDSNQVAVS